MTLEWDDVVDVLSLCACYDRRKAGDLDVAAWLDALTIAGVTSRDDAVHAVKVHYSRATDWCMPAHVADIVREVRSDRLKTLPADHILMEDVDAEDPNWAAIKAQRVRAFADRRAPLRAIGGVE